MNKISKWSQIRIDEKTGKKISYIALHSIFYYKNSDLNMKSPWLDKIKSGIINNFSENERKLLDDFINNFKECLESRMRNVIVMPPTKFRNGKYANQMFEIAKVLSAKFNNLPIIEILSCDYKLKTSEHLNDRLSIIHDAYKTWKFSDNTTIDDIKNNTKLNGDT